MSYLTSQFFISVAILFRTREEYYSLLQGIRDNGNWEEWILDMLSPVEETAYDTIRLVNVIKKKMQEMKHL